MLTQETAVSQAGAAAPPRMPLIAQMPDLIAPAVAGFGVPAMCLLVLGQFHQPLVLVLGLAGAAIAVALALPAAAPAAGRDTAWTLGALLVALGSFAVNGIWSAQNIYATRDPATYTLAGQWLARHSSVLVPAGNDIFGTVPGLTPVSPGFALHVTDPAYVYAQGNHLLPALLGMASWAAGPRALFRLNALIGALALLALFGLARRFAGGGFGLAGIAALAVSMPMLAFSRDTYTEPLSLLLTFGGLSLLTAALETGRRSLFALAGVTIGTSTMVRIDAYLLLYTVIIVAAVGAALAPVDERRAWLGRAGALAAGSGAAAVLGYIDVSRLSSGYYRDLRSTTLAEIKGAGVLLVLGVALVALAWRTRLGPWLAARPRRALVPGLCAGGVLVFFAVLASRPAWMVRHNNGCYWTVTVLQQAAHQPVDPCRSYDEHSVSWLSWYYGWPLVVVAVLGLAAMTYQLVRTRDLRLLGVLSAVLVLSALYLNAVSIVPDQIWAMRRFLPVVIPGLLVAAAYLLSLLATRGRAGLIGAVALAVLFVVTPALITHPMERVRTGAGQLAEVNATCAELPDDAAVVSLGRSAIGSYTQTMRSFCGVPTQVMAEATSAGLAQTYANVRRHGLRLFVIAESAAAVPYAPAVTDPQPLFIANTSKWPEVLVATPQWPIRYQVPIYVGQVDASGLVRPVGPVGPAS